MLWLCYQQFFFENFNRKLLLSKSFLQKIIVIEKLSVENYCYRKVFCRKLLLSKSFLQKLIAIEEVIAIEEFSIVNYCHYHSPKGSILAHKTYVQTLGQTSKRKMPDIKRFALSRFLAKLKNFLQKIIVIEEIIAIEEFSIVNCRLCHSPEGSMLAYQAQDHSLNIKTQGQTSKQNTKFLAKSLRVNKIAMKNFSRFPDSYVKIKACKQSNVRNQVLIPTKVL